MKKLTLFLIIIFLIYCIIPAQATDFNNSKSKISDEVWDSAVNAE